MIFFAVLAVWLLGGRCILQVLIIEKMFDLANKFVCRYVTFMQVFDFVFDHNKIEMRF